MKKEKNETLHWLDLNVTQSPWVVEQCPECGNMVWLKREEKTGKWKRETGGKMKANWIKGETKPPEDGKYYTIAEMQRDGIQFRTVDDLGRICIPKDIRDKLGIKPGTECAVCATDELTNEQIIVIRRKKNDKTNQVGT